MIASHHDTKAALRDALASLATESPVGPIRKVYRGAPGLYSGEYPALCVFATGSEKAEGVGADETFGPNAFLFSVVGVALKVPTGRSENTNERAEEEASMALSAWMDALAENPDLSGVSVGRPILSVEVLSTRSADSDQFGNEFFDAGGRRLWLDGAEVRVVLM